MTGGRAVCGEQAANAARPYWRVGIALVCRWSVVQKGEGLLKSAFLLRRRAVRGGYDVDSREGAEREDRCAAAGILHGARLQLRPSALLLVSGGARPCPKTKTNVRMSCLLAVCAHAPADHGAHRLAHHYGHFQLPRIPNSRLALLWYCGRLFAEDGANEGPQSCTADVWQGADAISADVRCAVWRGWMTSMV